MVKKARLSPSYRESLLKWLIAIDAKSLKLPASGFDDEGAWTTLYSAGGFTSKKRDFGLVVSLSPKNGTIRYAVRTSMGKFLMEPLSDSKWNEQTPLTTLHEALIEALKGHKAMSTGSGLGLGGGNGGEGGGLCEMEEGEQPC